jgi:folate-binding protein YgfZ
MTIRSPFRAIETGVGADNNNLGVAAHYGNPLTEQRLLASGRAIVDLSHHAVVTITGPDRLSWLNSLSSQQLNTLKPGESTETLFLDIHGRIEYAAGVLDDGETSYLLFQTQRVEPFISWLDRMRFMLRVEVRNATNEYATLGVMNTGTPLLLSAAAPNNIPLIWNDPWKTISPGGHQYATAVPHPSNAWHWAEILVERSQLATIVDQVFDNYFSAAGTLAAEALRIAAWRPHAPLDVDEKTIPHELDWLRTAVHLRKGCYRGQETVAKVHNLGHPPRRLVMLHLDGSESVFPSQGDTISLLKDQEYHPVGTITSSAMHYELGPIALAVIKRKTNASATLSVTHDHTVIPAQQEIIVPPDAGAVAQIPRLQRLGTVTSL